MARSRLAVAWRTAVGLALVGLGVLQLLVLVADFEWLDLVLGVVFTGLGLVLLARRARS